MSTTEDMPLRVLEIFNEFFGEERVDLHRTELYILVHFPHVTITNEHNRSTEINHLYAKVCIDRNGKLVGRFLLNRAEYSAVHVMNNYMHSHISNIPFHDFTEFQSPCTGSGPINNTMCSLNRDFDADLWRLFCLELDKYVQVESITGVPYHRLEGLSAGGGTYNYDLPVIRFTQKLFGNDISNMLLTRTQFADFTKYLIDKEILKFSFRGNDYDIAMSSTEIYIRVSNCFIDWYNNKLRNRQTVPNLSDLLASGILFQCKFSNGKLTREVNRHDPASYRQYIGQTVCTFKRQTIRVDIPDLTNPVQNHDNDILILNPNIIQYLLTKIINVINCRYGNSREEDPSACERAIFI